MDNTYLIIILVATQAIPFVVVCRWWWNKRRRVRDVRPPMPMVKLPMVKLPMVKLPRVKLPMVKLPRVKLPRGVSFEDMSMVYSGEEQDALDKAEMAIAAYSEALKSRLDADKSLSNRERVRAFHKDRTRQALIDCAVELKMIVFPQRIIFTVPKTQQQNQKTK